MASLLGLVLRDVLLTRGEYRAMAEGLADTDGPATGQIALSQWITEHKDTLGRRLRQRARPVTSADGSRISRGHAGCDDA